MSMEIQSTTVTQSPATALSPNTQINNITPSAAIGSKGMTFDQVENTWIQAGGNPQAAAMAAAIADAASGLNPSASQSQPDGTSLIGLWLVPQNGSPAGSTDPIANARAAIQLSNNGTDWSQWCVAWSDNNCGCDGGQYLGDGSNALGSLGQRLTPASYNVIGSAPKGSGASASSTQGAAPTSSKSKVLPIIAIIVIVVVVVLISRRKLNREGAAESQTRSQAPWSAAEEAMLSDSTKTDKQLSSDTGRSVRAIRVRRNQLKG